MFKAKRFDTDSSLCVTFLCVPRKKAGHYLVIVISQKVSTLTCLMHTTLFSSGAAQNNQVCSGVQNLWREIFYTSVSVCTNYAVHVFGKAEDILTRKHCELFCFPHKSNDTHVLHDISSYRRSSEFLFSSKQS